MSIVSVFRRLLSLQGTRVVGVEFFATALMICVDIAPRRRHPTCSRCGRRSAVGAYDSDTRLWRHLDLAAFELYLRYRLRRFTCRSCQAVVTEAVPWAEHGSVFTRDFEDVASFYAQQTNQTVVSRVMKISWPTVGNIVRRTVARRGTPLRVRKLYRIGVDEISYRKRHKYLSIVADHDTGHVVWAGNGKSGDALDPFLDALGDAGRSTIKLVTMDMSQAYISKVRERLPHAIIVFDPFHVVKLANEALDQVRRQQVRALKDKAAAQSVKKTRWILLKTPDDLDAAEAEKLSVLATVNRPLYRAYLLKEALRAVFRETPVKAKNRLDAWIRWACRSRLAPFVRLARTIRQHKPGILAAIEHGVSNGRLEGLNSKIRLISHRAFGFHSAEALIALINLCCSGIDLPLPSDVRPGSDPYAIM
jgi:transposase